jgi:hypothetical protein
MSDFVSLSAGRPAVAQLAGSAARSPSVPRHRAICKENTHPVAGATITYTYDTAQTTPEPGSMALFGGGLFAVSLIARKNLARR